MVVKPKTRYVLVKAEPNATAEKIFEEVRGKYREIFGLMGVAEADLRLYKIKDAAVIRCRLETVPKLLFSTALISEINGVPSAIRTLRISGTLKSLREKI